MSLFVASLNSGSNGNCYYLGNNQEAVLIDAGLSCRQIETRLSQLRLSLQSVKAVFISHEHTDHISGVETISRKYNLPVFITQPTLKNGFLKLNKKLIFPFNANEPVAIGNLIITPFEKKHDAADPFSFIVENDGVKVGVMTDIGTVCKQVIHYFSQCHACFLEANYDEQMLEEGSYPIHLKKRIRGENGHLSNRKALNLFMTHRSPFLSHLFLSHLSKENNHPDLVKKLFDAHAGNVKVVIASRYKQTEVYCITGSEDNLSKIKSSDFSSRPVQMSLFDGIF